MGFWEIVWFIFKGIAALFTVFLIIVLVANVLFACARLSRRILEYLLTPYWVWRERAYIKQAEAEIKRGELQSLADAFESIATDNSKEPFTSP